MRFAILVAGLMLFAWTSGCNAGGGEFPLAKEAPKGEAPYQKISKDGDDPADNGPDDSTEIDGMKGGAGVVKFPHAKHASNKGFGIKCNRCHHTTPDGEDPGEGCSSKGCHGAPEEGADPAHGGPDDNMVLAIGRAVMPVPFNHFTHASSAGYKQSCESCHHTGALVACGDCHKPLPTKGDAGTVVPKSKRAFHKQCIGCHAALKQNSPDSSAPTVCEQCHLARSFDIPKSPAKGLTRNRAFHIQCVGCHDTAKKAGGGKNAPTSDCRGCHAKAHDKEPTFAELAGELVKEGPVEDKPEFVRDPKLEENKGPEHIVIDHAKQAKSGTPFPHHLHQELGEDCYTCHHKGLQDPTCRSCHGDPASAKKAYHANCITCHKENGIPAGCADCHP